MRDLFASVLQLAQIVLVSMYEQKLTEEHWDKWVGHIIGIMGTEHLANGWNGQTCRDLWTMLELELTVMVPYRTF